MFSDKYILRLANVAFDSQNDDLVKLSTDKSEYTVRIPDFLRSKGKCKLTVQSVHIQIKNGAGNSIVPANSHTALIMTDGLQLLGYNNEMGGNVNVLCEMAIDSNRNDIRLGGATPPVFTCPSLPPTITLKKMVYDPALATPVAMNNYTDATVPCIVVLSLEFEEDMKN
tara:strand:+ start:342 stop:848 length:507 start_codon:yes stop_codon:yes gene_type:complete